MHESTGIDVAKETLLKLNQSKMETFLYIGYSPRITPTYKNVYKNIFYLLDQLTEWQILQKRNLLPGRNISIEDDGKYLIE